MPTSLLAGHGLFRARYFEHRDLLHELADRGQSPKALFITCCDSRVVPEFMTSASFGELFVVRNVANFVPDVFHSDSSVGAAIEYAVRHLRVPDIVVCGHYGCGGIQATVDELRGVEADEQLCEWLQGVAKAATAARRKGHVGQALLDAAVEENVLDALENLVTYDAVRQRLDAGSLHLHGWVYDHAHGTLKVFDAARGAFITSEA